MTAAFGMVAALAWNEAIKTLITETIGTSGSGILALIIYALIVTVIAVIATIAITRSVSKLKAKIEKEKPKEE